MMTREKAREMKKEFDEYVLSEEFEMMHKSFIESIDERIERAAKSGNKFVSVEILNEEAVTALANYYRLKRGFNVKQSTNLDFLILWS